MNRLNHLGREITLELLKVFLILKGLPRFPSLSSILFRQG